MTTKTLDFFLDLGEHSVVDFNGSAYTRLAMIANIDGEKLGDMARQIRNVPSTLNVSSSQRDQRFLSVANKNVIMILSLYLHFSTQISLQKEY